MANSYHTAENSAFKHSCLKKRRRRKRRFKKKEKEEVVQYFLKFIVIKGIVNIFIITS